MIYQLRTNLFFRDIDAIDDIKDKILGHFDDATVVNPNSENQELSILEIIENHHDEDPNQPCTATFTISNQPPPPD